MPMHATNLSDPVPHVPTYPFPPSDRRKHVRYHPKVIIYAAVGPDYHMVGRVLNISREGLCFTYFDFDDANSIEEPFSITNRADIYTVDSSLKLWGIRCVITHNGIYTEKDYIRFAWMVPPLRRCCIRFEAMNRGQENELAEFILAYAVVDS